MGFKVKVKPKHVIKGAKVFTKVAKPACLVVETIYPPSKVVTKPIKAAAKVGKFFL